MKEKLDERRVNVRKLRNLILTLMCMLIAFTPVLSDAETSESNISDSMTNILQTDEYTLCASSDSLQLYANLKSGEFYINQLCDNYKWYSIPNNVEDDKISTSINMFENQSQLIVGYIFIEDEDISTTSKSIDSNSGSYYNGGVSVTKCDDGIIVSYYFDECGFTIPVKYVLKDDKFVASINVKDIDFGDKCYITYINLLPNFGAADSKTNGYFLVPDGCGAVINMNNGSSLKKYEGMVYGDEVSLEKDIKTSKFEQLYMPVFGSVIDQHALLAIISEGDSNASIIANISNENQNYNKISSKSILRQLDTKTLFADDSSNTQQYCRISDNKCGPVKYEVSYFFLSGEKANYSGMAECYRNYLLKKNALPRKTEGKAALIKLYGTIDAQKNFLGIPYRGHKNLTTFEDAQNIVSQLADEDVSSVNIQYDGWMKDGVESTKIMNSAKPYSGLGGKSGFKKLVELCKKNSFEFTPEAQMIDFQKTGDSYFQSFSCAKDMFGEKVESYPYYLSTYQQNLTLRPTLYLKANKSKEKVEKFSKSIGKLGIKQISFDNLASFVFTDFFGKKQVNRAEAIDYYNSALKQAAKTGLNIQVNSANAYAFPYINTINCVPMVSSSYDIFSYDIPFYQMVLHGTASLTGTSVNRSDEWKQSILNAVAFGTGILFDCINSGSDYLNETRYNYLYGSSWSEIKNKIFANCNSNLQ